MSKFLIAVLLIAVFPTFTSAQILENFSFNNGNGAYPYAGLLQGRDGDFYGTTEGDGRGDQGTVFKITSNGKFVVLYKFCTQGFPACPDGAGPLAALIQATDGNFYGTTLAGGTNNNGTIFRVTPGGQHSTIYSFCSLPNCADGQYPHAGLVEGADGNLYGTTYGNQDTQSYGTVYKIGPTGELSTIYTFCSQADCADGIWPTATLVRSENGSFYGTTTAGGADGNRHRFQYHEIGR